MLAAHIFVVTFLFRENSRTKTDKKILLTGPLSDHKVALTIYFCQNQIGTVLNADLMLNFILLKVGTGTGISLGSAEYS